MHDRCGVRAQYYKHHSGLCVLPKHAPDLDHLVEIVSIDTQKTRYDQVAKGLNQCSQSRSPQSDESSTTSHTVLREVSMKANVEPQSSLKSSPKTLETPMSTSASVSSTQRDCSSTNTSPKTKTFIEAEPGTGPSLCGSPIQLRPHQQKAVDQLSNGKILWGGVGTGKSRTAMAYFFSKVCKGVYGDLGSMREPRDLYIITTAKKRDSLDWEGEAARFGIGKELDGSIPGVTMTVDSWNNIGKYEGISGAFFIFDEQRLVGSGAWTKAFIKIAKLNQWILLSATPGDTWLDYIPVFVANGFYKNRTEFKRRHVVYNTYSKFPKVDRYIETGRLVSLRNNLLVHMPYARHTVRQAKDVKVDYDVELFEKVVKKRWHVYEERPIRDVAELFSVMRKVVNSHSSRLECLRTIMSTHPKLIVFYNFDYELEMLRTLSNASTTDPNLQNSAILTGVMDRNPNADIETLRTLGNSIEESSVKSGVTDSSSPELLRTLSNETTTKRDASWNSQPEEKTRTTKTDQLSLSQAGAQSIGLETRSGERSKRQSEGSFEKSTTQSSESRTSKHSSEKSVLPGNETPGNTTAATTNASSQCETSTQSVQIAEWNGHKHEPIPDSERWVYLVQYVAGAEGWNCIETNAICFYSLTYSYKNYEQAMGRIDRLNTPFTDLWYYTLLSDSLIDKAVSKSLKSKKNFNESDFGSRL